MKVSYISSIFLFAGFIQCFSQNEIDSLKSLIPSLSDTSLIDAQLNLSRSHAIYGNNEEGIEVAMQALENSRRLNSSGRSGQSFFYLSINHNHPDSVLKYSNNAIEIFEPINHPWLPKAYGNAGRMLRRQGKFTEALYTYQKLLDLAIAQNDSLEIGDAYQRIGYTYDRMRDYHTALEYHEKSLIIYKAINSIQCIGEAFGNKGIAYDELKEYDKAVEFNTKAIEIFREVNDEYLLGIWLSNLGNTYTKLKDYENAVKCLQESFEIKKRNDENSISISAINIGNLYMDIGKYNLALKYLHFGDSVAKANQYLRFETESQYRLAEYYMHIGNTEQAFKHLENYNLLNDSLMNVTKAEAVAEAETKYQTEKKEQQLKLLSSENEVLELEKNKTETRLYGSLGILALFLLAGFFTYRTYKYRKDSTHQKELIAERESGIRALITVSENERQRIAKDLHDGLGQQLSGIKLKLDAIVNRLSSSVKEKPMLVNVTHVLDDACIELRSVSHQMMPKALNELGLIPALDDMLLKSFESTDIKYQFEHFGIDQRLKKHVEIGLFRICQELVNNIIKHSNAKHLNVQLYKTKDHIILIVEDDGVGFNPENKKDGIGIQNIKSRLSDIHGEARYETGNRKGTTATIKIPLEEAL